MSRLFCILSFQDRSSSRQLGLRGVSVKTVLHSQLLGSLLIQITGPSSLIEHEHGAFGLRECESPVEMDGSLLKPRHSSHTLIRVLRKYLSRSRPYWPAGKNLSNHICLGMIRTLCAHWR
jgi:hypothetical protein